jgi:hypothetical protein
MQVVEVAWGILPIVPFQDVDAKGWFEFSLDIDRNHFPPRGLKNLSDRASSLEHLEAAHAFDAFDGAR